jgi:hypothetical protein
MPRLTPRYRDLPRFALRRMDRIAGEVNCFLLVAAIALAMLDFLFAAQKLVDALPPAPVHISVPAP